MRRRSMTEQSEAQPPAGLAAELSQELEARGVAPGFAEPVAEHLAAGDVMSGPQREAVLEGVVIAYAAHQLDYEALEESSRNIDEIQRLMRGFAGELRKLEEGLRIVSAYVLRMHDKASGEISKRVH